jgi:hypothetical protein
MTRREALACAAGCILRPVVSTSAERAPVINAAEHVWAAEQELYDLVSDPYETTNLAKLTAYATLRTALRARAMALCSPTPPGFTW